MFKLSSIASFLNHDRSLRAINLSAFLNAISFGTLFLALPFAITAVGGSDKDLGLAMGLCYGGYILSCSSMSFFIDRFNQKRLVQIGLSLISLFTFWVCMVVYLNGNGKLNFDPVFTMIIAVGLVGLCQTFIWPPLMGWVSSGYEGPELTRRLGKYNFSWSIAFAIWPFVAGYLIEINLFNTMLVSVFTFLMSLVVISFAKRPTSEDTANDQQTVAELDPAEKLLAKRLLVCARTGLFLGAAIFILPRTQLAILMTQEYGYTESDFGILSAVFCLTLWVLLTFAGRNCHWHNKFTPMVLSTLLIGAGIFLIIFSGIFAVLLLAAVAIALGYGFFYMSHQYYGVSGGKKRSALMAIHEITLATGFVFGSVTGGFISDKIDRFAPYRWGLALMALNLAVVLAVALWSRIKPGTKAVSQNRSIS